jgi:signal transduction histidine kinase
VIGFRRALWALAALGFIGGALAGVLALTNEQFEDRIAQLVFGPLIAWAFIGTGLFAWYRAPDNRCGPLMTAVGFTWALKGMMASDNEAVFAAGLLFNTAAFGFLFHMLIAFPSGRLQGRFQQWLVAGAYFATTVLHWALVPFLDTSDSEWCDDCPDNALQVSDSATAEGVIASLQALLAVTLLAATSWILWRRWRDASQDERRALGPVLVTGGLNAALLGLTLVWDLADLSDDIEYGIDVAGLIAFTAIPFGFLAGLLRTRVSQAASLEVENVRRNAELQQKVEELTASRQRLVDAEFRGRRRLERDLHDGAQQRLVSLALGLRMARTKLPGDPEKAAELLESAAAELDTALAELRELARGIHPAVLSDRGLDAAVAALAGRAPLEVEVAQLPDDRLPEQVESAAYFVVAEALTNVAKYAQASRANVSIRRYNGRVVVEVSDDGVGGADPAKGSGLRGLADRLSALEGRLAVESEPGRGTTVTALIPCG